MGQTLSHGVYLPAEGERNCYSGLASNWNLLDTAIGDTAGKASATHTHGNITNDGKVGTTANLPLITGTGGVVQAGSFGNQANTFCEGNDSRLSDARTPVAHTHVTADVTDLLNSAHTWTGDNTFAAAITSKGLNITNNGRIYTEVPSLTKGTLPSGTYYYSIQNDYATDSSSANNRINQKRLYVTTDGTNVIEWNLTAWNTTNIAVLKLSIAADGTSKTYVIGADAIPGANNTYNLGNSTYRWKSFNGVNPGALSLPDMGTTADVNYFDFISTITHLDGTDNFYTPTVDGWMTVVIAGTALSLFEDAASATNHNQGSGVSVAPVKGYCLATIPVHKNVRVKINAIGTSVYMAQVRPCMGNV